MALATRTAQRPAAAGCGRARCVRVSAVHQPGKALAASAAAALLLCSPFMATPLPANPVATLAKNPVSAAVDAISDKAESLDAPKLRAPSNVGTAKGSNMAQGAAAPEDRPAVYAEGKGQTNAPCPTGQTPCY